MNHLVDTTEMYLKTILELEEERVTPLRARIAERLCQSGPTVSQTVARMERDGLVTVQDDRHLRLTAAGRARAVAVMRKHRLAERLLVDVIGIRYENAHQEACRWEHVISEAVERRVFQLLGAPERSPYGNSIPGLADLAPVASDSDGYHERNLASPELTGAVVVRRICESAQNDTGILHQLHRAGMDPGAKVTVAHQRDGVAVDRAGERVHLPREIAARIFVVPV